MCKWQCIYHINEEGETNSYYNLIPSWIEEIITRTKAMKKLGTEKHRDSVIKRIQKYWNRNLVAVGLETIKMWK